MDTVIKINDYEEAKPKSYGTEQVLFFLFHQIPNLPQITELTEEKNTQFQVIEFLFP